MTSDPILELSTLSFQNNETLAFKVQIVDPLYSLTSVNSKFK